MPDAGFQEWIAFGDISEAFIKRNHLNLRIQNQAAGAPFRGRFCSQFHKPRAHGAFTPLRRYGDTANVPDPVVLVKPGGADNPTAGQRDKVDAVSVEIIHLQFFRHTLFVHKDRPPHL